MVGEVKIIHFFTRWKFIRIQVNPDYLNVARAIFVSR